MHSQTILTRRLWSLALGAALMIALTASAKAQSGVDRESPSRAAIDRTRTYFPLQPGYKWVYAVKGLAGGVTWRVEVRDGQLTDAAWPTYELSGYFLQGSVRSVGVNTHNNVVEKGPSGRNYLWYRLGARVGDTWKRQLAPPIEPQCEDGVTLMMAARDEVVSVPAGQFSRVIRIDTIGPRCADAGIISEWFAPGVGLIRREQQSIAGPVVSELAYAELGDVTLPLLTYSTSLRLSSPLYVNNLMPPVGPRSLPRVYGSFLVRNDTDAPAELVFAGCKRIRVEVRDDSGRLLWAIEPDDGGCCECKSLVRVDLRREPFIFPFNFTLSDRLGNPLADGVYAIVVRLKTLESEFVQPSAQARIEVESVH